MANETITISDLAEFNDHASRQKKTEKKEEFIGNTEKYFSNIQALPIQRRFEMVFFLRSLMIVILSFMINANMVLAWLSLKLKLKFETEQR